MKKTLSDIERCLGYHFSNQSLLTIALTHSSASKENNERLEFLGDALLSVIIGEYLFTQFPSASEGLLSRIRASLVKGEALASLANQFRLSNFIVLGPGEALIEGQCRSSILAGTMEALMGAIYLDAGFDICRQSILRWYAHLLRDIDIHQAHVDAKTELQEMMQAKRLPLPVYSVLEQYVGTTQSLFKVECRLDVLDLATQAQGRNKKHAEQVAARLMIEKLKVEKIDYA